MKISQCIYGRLVCLKNSEGVPTHIGMVKGIGNYFGKPAPYIQWWDKRESVLHEPDDLYIYEE